MKSSLNKVYFKVITAKKSWFRILLMPNKNGLMLKLIN